MKLRNFKKSIHRKGDYKYYEPRINQKIFIKDNTFFVYYWCHNLRARLCLDTNEFMYIITKKRKRHEQGHSPKAE